MFKYMKFVKVCGIVVVCVDVSGDIKIILVNF